MHVCVSACMHENMPHACLVPSESKGGIPVPGTGVADYFEVVCWPLNLGPGQEQQVFFTDEPPLQPWA